MFLVGVKMWGVDQGGYPKRDKKNPAEAGLNRVVRGFRTNRRAVGGLAPGPPGLTTAAVSR